MKIGILILCLIASGILIKAQDTCGCSSQLTQIQMQSQIDRDNLNAKIDQQAKTNNASITQAKTDIFAKMDEDFAQHDKNMLADNNRVIDQVLIRAVVTLFATSGWFFSLTTLAHYGRL